MHNIITLSLSGRYADMKHEQVKMEKAAEKIDAGCAPAVCASHVHEPPSLFTLQP